MSRAILLTLFFVYPFITVCAADAIFFRAINLNGPAAKIDGHAWEASKDAKDFSATGTSFENQKVTLRPATDAARAQMIRSSRYGSKIDVELKNLPAGKYQVVLYVWEDNNNERFKLLVNDRTVVDAFESGTAGMWKRLGPWLCEPVSGKIVVSARAPSHGAANLSGVEVWSGDGAIPNTQVAKFADSPSADQIAFFESKIRPLLIEHCYDCHSATAKKVKGGLMLDSRAGVRKGGENGAALTPGDPDASHLIQAIRHTNEDTAMPPDKKLSPEQIAALTEWVKLGAPDPRTEDTVAAVEAKAAIDWKAAREWWSFKPLAISAVPSLKEAAWPLNEIDRFVLARVEAAGLKPAADASKRTLIRRATYDLTGLPPTPEETAAFLADSAPDAFAKIVERLLASPAYGERWGRHWLDVVRYADSAGDNSDFPIPQMHRYRDWVIGAFNRDLPYDQFVREQLAGDLLPARTPEQLVATGYIANSRRFGSRVDDYPQHLTIEDTIDNFGRSFLGLTVNCARCHDHKFDPITAQDYYAIYGMFNSTRYPWPGIELEQRQRDLVPMVELGEVEKATKALSEHRTELQRFEKEVKKLEEGLKKRQDEAKKKLEEVLKSQHADEKKKLDAELQGKTDDEKKKLEAELKSKHDEEKKKLDAEVKTKSEEEKKKSEAEIAKAKSAVEEYAQKKPPVEVAYAVGEAAKMSDAAVQMKGDPARKGAVVRRRFLTVFGGAEVPADDASSGRLKLASWVLNDSRALAARVAVNRIWQHHFERGIVPTANDFGKQGKSPTHPELLDWLATRFISDGWSIKKMHRLIMHSRTYQLSGTRSAEALVKDASNELLASFPRRRLDAEAIRDTLLLLGGTLDRTPAGAHPFPPQTEWKYTQHNPFKSVYESNRRSVYLMTQRIQRHPYLAIFDGADPSTSTPARVTSTTPLQALFLLNDPLVHDQAKRIAERVFKDGKDDAARLARAYELALNREPAPEEVAHAETFLKAAREKLRASKFEAEKIDAEVWQAMLRVILRLNEFVYID